MHNQERIRETFERNARALALRPAIGRNTAVTRVRVREGLQCEVEEGPWKLTVDMSEKSGGTNTGPNPGTLGRGALGSCLAIGYMLWASKLGVPIRNLEVEVQADYDSGPAYGVSDEPAGYRRIRCLVTVESDAPEADILRMLDEGDAHSAYLDVFSRAQDVQRTVRIVPSER
jgi:uncharacterized OsmC-like protein